MVVIAIVALLAAVAVPTYKGYLNKAKASEINGLIQAQMAAAATAYSNGASAPSAITPADGSVQNVSALINSTGPQVYVLFPASAAFDTNLNGIYLSFVGTDSNGVITWACSGTAAGQGYLSAVPTSPTVGAHVTASGTAYLEYTGAAYFAVNGTGCT